MSSDLNRRLLLDHMLNEDFIIEHDFSSSETSIISGSPEKILRLNESGIGISVETAPLNMRISNPLIYVPTAILQPKRILKEEIVYPDGIYSIPGYSKGKAFTFFSVPTQASTVALEHQIEDKISNIETGYSRGLDRAGFKIGSISSELHYQSYEHQMLEMMLGNINDILLSKHSAYKVAFVIEATEGHEDIVRYLKANSIVLGEKKVKVNDIQSLSTVVKKMESLPMSYSNASRLLCLSGTIRKVIKVGTRSVSTSGDIRIGAYLPYSGAKATGEASMTSKTLNLGTIITGLPGTGKTKTAERIVEKSLVSRPSVFIISPTNEWNSFGHYNSLNVVRIGRPNINLNFFNCEYPNISNFYENLAMLVAAVSNPGPYRNSTENCLMSAFAKVYSSSSNPDPQDVYEEIEESIIEQHGKRIGTSIRYTKHGENIKSGLESLRQILMEPQFAYSQSTSLKELIKQGVVFDLSYISNKLKPIVYALLLNHAYNLCDEFDTKGDNELRLLICLEEAQLVFNSEEESGATLDLKERIQNFRKTGVGLILIAHNVNDINQGIRRICQNKLYFRQSADIAKYAANDLIFSETDYDKVVDILKTLGQKECAVNIITINSGEKIVANSTFVKVDDYTALPEYNVEEALPKELKDTEIKIVSDDKFIKLPPYELFYLGECISRGAFETDCLIKKNLLQGKRYKIILLGERRKDNKTFDIIGGNQNIIRL